MIKFLDDVVFTGIQPSGKLTIGNYFGTMQHWSNFQNKYKCFFCIADLHMLTSLTKINKFKLFPNSILDTLALFLSCGVDPKKSVIFLQSSVSFHTQLYWILSCFSYFGELKRMVQFKQRMLDKKNKINSGLFSYPILMASDILLYNTSIVPIGKDQIQHLELVRKIAARFNKIYGKIFVIPNGFFSKVGSKIMSLQNPTIKMSKSDNNKNNVIYLLDSLDSINFKIKHSLTDSEKPSKIFYDPIKKPGISNLITIFSLVTKKSIPQIENEFIDKNYNYFKSFLIEVLSEKLKKIHIKYNYYRKDESFLKYILKKGKEKSILEGSFVLNKVMNLFFSV